MTVARYPAGVRSSDPKFVHRSIAALVLAFSALTSGCAARVSRGPALEPTGPETVDGPLTRTPIRFGTTDYVFWPTYVEAELGRLRVPERHDRPDGRQIEVRYVRFAATGKGSGSNYPIVYLAGGPGGSGTWSASGDRFPLFQKLRAIADVVAFDQRGTWGTEPYMICPGSVSYPLDQPADPAILSAVVRPYLEECATHWGAQADLSAYNTMESVADLEALRVALGADKLTLWGISYGTHLGLAYIRTHPDRVYRAILAGVEGPDHTYKLPAPIEAVVERVERAIQSDPRASRIAPDFVGSMRALVQELDREPATVPVEDPKTGETVSVVVGGQDLRQAFYEALGEREDIEGELIAQGVPILRGDLTALGRFALQRRREIRMLVMTLSMDCASGASEGRRSLIREQAPTTLLGNSNLWLEVACPLWPVDDLGDDFRSPLRADVPVLFISGSLDVKTPPENAEEILAGFPNGRHLLIEGGSHDDDLFLSSPRIAEAMLSFLHGGEPPRRIELPPLRFELP